VPYDCAVPRLEFTIEPFVEGRPGPHVTAPIDALVALGIEVEVGPFGTSCTVETSRSAAVVATIVEHALEHGASHVNIDVTAEDAP
jgi:uncharacterized protein YqgV (UPF0045/DUF77 family)